MGPQTGAYYRFLQLSIEDPGIPLNILSVCSFCIYTLICIYIYIYVLQVIVFVFLSRVMSSDLSVRSFLASTIFFSSNGQVLLRIVLRVRGGDLQSA